VRDSSSKENVALRAEGGPAPSACIENIGDGLPSGRSPNIRLQVTFYLLCSLKPLLSLWICDYLRRWSVCFELRAHFLNLRGLLCDHGG